MKTGVIRKLLLAAGAIGVLIVALGGPAHVPAARADDSGALAASVKTGLPHLVVKLSSGNDPDRLLAAIKSTRSSEGKGSSYYDASLVYHFANTAIYVLAVKNGDAERLGRQLEAKKSARVEWAEAGKFVQSFESEQFRQAAYEQFRQAAYEQFRQAAYEQFRQAAYEQFRQAAYEQFRQAAYEQFSQAAYEQFRQAAYEQFSQAAFEQFSQAAFEQFSQAAFEQFSQAAFERFQQVAYEQFSQALFDQFQQVAYEQFSQAVFERFTQAVYEQFRQAVYEQFRQVAYEQFSQAFFDQFAQAVFEQFAQSVSETYDLTHVERFSQAAYEQFRHAAYESTSGAIAALIDDPDFRTVFDGVVLSVVTAIRADQLARAKSQYGLIQIESAEANQVATGKGIVVAVLDTGVSGNHWMLQGAIAPGGIDLVDGDFDPTDAVGHGTFVAGLIRLVAPEARILPIRVKDDLGQGWSFIVAEGIYRAVDAGAHVINLSLSTDDKSTVLGEALKYAQSKGVVMVAAAGNDSEDAALYPAAYPEVLGVAATQKDKKKASFSNYGKGVLLAAPGEELYGPLPIKGTTGMGYWSGTSFSTALVSGEAALLYQGLEQKSQSARKVRSAMEKSAESLEPYDPEFGSDLGKGLIQVSQALGAKKKKK